MKASLALWELNLASCRVTQLVSGAAGDVHFSANGRWLAYTPSAGGAPRVVPAAGGAARAPLGPGIQSWSWSPSGARLYGIDARGRLLAAAPGQRAMIVAGGGSPVPGGPAVPGGPVVAPDDRLVAEDRSRCTGPVQTEIDTVTLPKGGRHVVLRRARGPATIAGWSPDSRWLEYWQATMCSASLAADGWPLMAIRAVGGRPVRAVAHMLLYPDYLAWCGDRLIVAVTPSRETQLGSALVATGPPTWGARRLTSRSLSWVSPVCSPSGQLVAASAGPSTQDAGFGHQHRSLWLLSPDGTLRGRLTDPPSIGLSDEAPRFSRDGRWILFVRTQVGTGAASQDILELVPASPGASPVPVVSFTSADISYYDHFQWPTEIAWSQAAQP